MKNLILVLSLAVFFLLATLGHFRTLFDDSRTKKDVIHNKTMVEEIVEQLKARDALEAEGKTLTLDSD